jgi:hypothetical protein
MRDYAHVPERCRGDPAFIGGAPDTVSELFRHVDHVVDGSLHEIVRQVDAAAFGGHHT